MAKGYLELRQEEFTKELENFIAPRLAKTITERADGHCMRIGDLDEQLMLALATRLRHDLGDKLIFVLAYKESQDDEMFVSSTKLVELRNPNVDGSLRPPLLVFLPPNLRASAEDSFSIATFESIELDSVYRDFIADFIQQRLPGPLQYIRSLLTAVEKKWEWASPVAQVRYLLTALKNGIDAESMGAALYELGLIPDFQVFQDHQTAEARLVDRNVETVSQITNSVQSIRGRVLNLNVVDKPLQRRLIDLLMEYGTSNPLAWTRQIALDPAYWDLGFHNWRFSDQIYSDRIRLRVLGIDLPIAENETDERLRDIIGQQYLAPQERRRFQVTFEVEPHPAQVKGLAYFTVQLLHKDIATDTNSLTGITKNVQVWKAKRSWCTVSVDKLNRVDLEEGWHFIRVLPWSANDEPIPVDKTSSANESDLFYVIPDEEFEEKPKQRAIPQDESVEHARLRVQFTALNEGSQVTAINPQAISWSDPAGYAEQLVAQFGKYGAVHIPVPKYLKDFEQQILKDPSGAVCRRLEIPRGQVGNLVDDITDWFPAENLDHFLDVRREYFEAILHGEKNLVTQGADFLALTEICGEYAEAYSDLLSELSENALHGVGLEQQAAISNLRKALLIDTIRITLTDFAGNKREAVLVAPTHPLRVLWMAEWSRLAQDWLLAVSSGSVEHLASVRNAIAQIVPLHVPVGIPLYTGRVFVTVANLNFFWSLYAPTTEQDTPGLLGDISTALQISEPTIGGSAVTAEMLASRVQRYLIQHPYVRTLNLNVFNPGRGRLLADALVELQKQPELADLRYNIRLFVSDANMLGVGEALLDLMQSSGSTTMQGADAFAASTGNHLFPKLAVSIQSIQDFPERPGDYPAHVSILIDLFPAADIVTDKPIYNHPVSAPLNGLIQEYVVQFQDSEDQGAYWRRQPRHKPHLQQPVVDDSRLQVLLQQLPRLISEGIASVATHSPQPDMLPVIRMGLDPKQRQLLHSVHDISDWVFTIDRHLGIELFDHGNIEGRTDYLIDYTPSILSSFSSKLVITTKSLAEIEALLQPSIAQLGSLIAEDNSVLIFEQLRLLSGRLALKLISASPNQRIEAISLALARLLLLREKALVDKFVIPLDDCLYLFRNVRQSDEQTSVEEAISMKRTDLALIGLDYTERKVTCILIEVKCHNLAGNLGAFISLRDAAQTQLEETERVLRAQFDPNNKIPDRPDRLLKTREFTTLLQFYLERSLRYRLLDPAIYAESLKLLDSLDEGYHIEFDHLMFLFDLDSSGSEIHHEPSATIYRVGRNEISELVANSTRFQVAIAEKHRTADEKTELSNSETGAMLSEEKQVVLMDEDQVSAQTEAALLDAHLQEADEFVGTKIQVVAPEYEIMIGSNSRSPQYSLIGSLSGRKIALDFNQTHTISLFGVQGSGKSYTLGSLIESACLPIQGVNILPVPLSAVVFHYSQSKEYSPEFVTMKHPNSDAGQIARLKSQYNADPHSLSDIILVVPPSKMDDRRREFPDVKVVPLQFASTELSAAHWKYLMGAVGNPSLYLRQIGLIIRQLGSQITLESIQHHVNQSSQLRESDRELAQLRLQLAAPYILDGTPLGDILKPGRLVIVDLRDEAIEPREALELFAVLLQIFSDTTYDGRPFSKLIVFDEAHKYMNNPSLTSSIIELVREMRHKATSILVASQEPRSVPVSLIELSTEIILHRFSSPDWLKHVQRANVALGTLKPTELGNLKPGEAYIWSSKATEEAFTAKAVKIELRPRVTKHGGDTKTAL